MRDARLFVDIQTIQSAHHGDRGIPRFATELSRTLVTGDAPVAALALNPLRPFPRRLDRDLARSPRLTWNTATAFRRARAEGPLQYVVLSPFEDVRPVADARPADGVLAPHVTGAPRVAVVYDLIPEAYGYLPADTRARAYERRRAWVRDSDLLVTLSEHTRRDVIERWDVEPERVAVIGAAAAPFFSSAEGGEGGRLGATVPSITRPFVLSVAGRLRHKNPQALVDAWAKLDPRIRADHQLVIVCTLPHDFRAQMTERIEQQGLTLEDVVLTGFVPDDVLRELYRAAALFVLPSHHEGFGLPVLEAVACGALAISSNSSSLPEILEWPEALFRPDDTDELAARIERGLTDSAYRAELRGVCNAAARRYTWDRVGERLLTRCARLPTPPSRRDAPRLAMVGPFPPARSRRALANLDIARRLAARCELDCFVETGDHPALAPPRSPREYRTFPARSLGHVFSPATYDAVVYTIGPGYTSVETRRLAATYPGIAVADDVTGADLVANARATVVEPDPERAATALLDLACSDLEPPRPVEAPPARERVAG